MVVLRTGFNKTKNIKIDYQGSFKNKIKEVLEEEHILGYIKSGVDKKGNQIYWFESNKKGRVYIIANEELFKLGFYNYLYKTRDLKVIGVAYRNHQLKIKEILE